MLRKCERCGYTLREACRCGRTKSVHPPKFSPADRHAKYRRIAKKGKIINNIRR